MIIMTNLRKIQIQISSSLSQFYLQKCCSSRIRNFCSKKDDSSSYSQEIKTDSHIKLPAEPENCCMSGCENCVWKQYASELTEMYNHSGEQAKKIILEKIKDPTMQVFLKMELEFLDKKK